MGGHATYVGDSDAATSRWNGGNSWDAGNGAAFAPSAPPWPQHASGPQQDHYEPSPHAGRTVPGATGPHDPYGAYRGEQAPAGRWPNGGYYPYTATGPDAAPPGRTPRGRGAAPAHAAAAGPAPCACASPEPATHADFQTLAARADATFSRAMGWRGRFGPPLCVAAGALLAGTCVGVGVALGLAGGSVALLTLGAVMVGLLGLAAAAETRRGAAQRLARQPRWHEQSVALREMRAAYGALPPCNAAEKRTYAALQRAEARAAARPLAPRREVVLAVLGGIAAALVAALVLSNRGRGSSGGSSRCHGERGYRPPTGGYLPQVPLVIVGGNHGDGCAAAAAIADAGRSPVAMQPRWRAAFAPRPWPVQDPAADTVTGFPVPAV